MGLINLTTIRDKLIAITMISCIISLVVAGSMMILYSWDTHKESAVNRLHVLSEVLGNRSRAALVFNDQPLVQENLQSLQYEPSVLLACIYTLNSVENGQLRQSTKLVGEYHHNANQQQSCPEHPEIDRTTDSYLYDRNGNMFIVKDITFGEETLGKIIMYSDNRIIMDRIIVDTIIILIIILIGISVAYMLIKKLQGYISRPIQKLSQTATQISRDRDASIRARHYSNDETGMLVSAFNNMLDTIEQQNESLTKIKNNYLSLYDKNPMMLFTLNLHGDIIAVNEYGATHIGKTIDELISTNFCKLVYKSDHSKAEAFINSCSVNDNHVQRKELRIIDATGRIIWTRTTSRCIINEADENHILLVCEDITEQKRLSEKLSYQASHDSLTGLVNRREFENRISKAIENTKIDDNEHALFFLDLDQFKIINDTCGHLAGDHLLREIVSLISPLIRQGDTLARIGGDEFGVLLEKCAIQQAQSIGEQIRQKINDYRFVWEDREMSIGVSIGVVPINSATPSITIAMSDADAACYLAKDAGRNRLHIYQQGDEDIATRHGEMTWVNKIQQALNNDRFILAAQQITGLNEEFRHDRHYEILVRMIDESGDTVAPGEFLPAAERYNLTPSIDRWVISNTFSWFSSHPDILETLTLCSINLSGNTLSDDTFTDFLFQQFEQYNIPSQKICFEITETSAISNLDVAQRFFHSFSKELRCKFSLDDFGTGLSSFAYLKTMPVDYIKIDGQFVKDITSDQIDMAMVRSINEIGQIMGKKTIAEFVESEQILKQLKLIGIDYVQGYHIARPVLLDELADSQPKASNNPRCS
jgi:diguanylate cyclase (GGDEF)-like protein/PAS domain S-box-containing protein